MADAPLHGSGRFWLVWSANSDQCTFAQVADEDEIRSGVRREGSFFGVNALLTKPAQSIAIALIPWILEMTKFVTRASNNGETFLNQPASAIFGIKVLIGLIPGVAMILGAVLLFLFPLGENTCKRSRIRYSKCTLKRRPSFKK
jgi:GPH family glycoside/pentoside/hexuronide:cation symporter